MNFIEDIILENDNVLLKPLNDSYIDELLVYVNNEPKIWKYSLMPLVNRDTLMKYIQQAIEGRLNKKTYAFVVLDKMSNNIVGTTRLYDYNQVHKSVLIGYTWYAKKAQGTGINKNCKLLLFSYVFETLKLERVEFRTDVKNEKSIRAIMSLGCIKEGVLRSNYTTHYGRRDSIIFSILKKEWLNGVKDKLLLKI